MALLATALLAVSVDASALTLMQQRKTTTTQTKKKTTAKATARRHTSTVKKTRARKSAVKKKTTRKATRPTYSTAEIRGLQSKRSAMQKEIKKQEAALRANQANVKNGSTICSSSTAR